MKHIDSVLYVDTDTIFLSPVNQIWQLFNQFNSSQIAGLSPEHEDKNVGWYNRFARHPFYGALGRCIYPQTLNFTYKYMYFLNCRCELWCNVNEPYANEKIQMGRIYFAIT